ncbi:MAG TPA: aldo/keto reductase [Candidatus Dormibacteraeota bacterium]|nr:aldo/keto reductase [Candidatus Dormibacteraeota bacterium]
MATKWLDASELRIGLGCMRLSTDEDHGEQRAFDTIAAAVESGVTVFDTARAYGQNENVLSRALRQCGAANKARIVTKGGMTRAEGRWIPDGRGKSILTDCESSLRALEGLPIDLYLIHAPDPRTAWSTSVRALVRARDQGLVKRIGVSNVNRRQLEEALAITDITAVEVAVNPFDDRAIRGGVIELCEKNGIALIAHSPLGGPRRSVRLDRMQPLVDMAGAIGATPAQMILAWLLDLSPCVIAIPGARRPETARSAARAAEISLHAADRTALAKAFGGRRTERVAPARPSAASEVVLIMGIPGAGKSRIAQDLVGRGYARLNRDERGGTLREIAFAVDAELAPGTRRLVLDNTYLTRASRNLVVEAAKRHDARVRCMWIDTPLDQAQVNLVMRLLERYGRLPSPDELRRLSRTEAGVHTPTSQMRTVRELEMPSIDEGFADVERLLFVRASQPGRTRAGLLVAADVMKQSGWERAIEAAHPDAPHLVFDWCPEKGFEDAKQAAAQLAKVVAGPVEVAVCTHGGGPPICWCRPPLPGLPLAFAQAHQLDLTRSILVGTTAVHRRLAATLGAQFIAVSL